jgi:hypothetical protein
MRKKIRNTIKWFEYYSTFIEINNILKLLIDRGADVNHVNNEGETPLFIAVGRFSIVRSICSG